MNNSIALMAPHELPGRTIILPNPKLSNDTALRNLVKVKEYLDGTLRSYVQTTNRRLFSMSFELTQDKEYELQEFFELYSAAAWRFFHWDETVWVVHSKDPTYAATSVGIGEYKEVTLELEGFRLA